MFNFGVVGAYGSGADLRKTSANWCPGHSGSRSQLCCRRCCLHQGERLCRSPYSETGSFDEGEVFFASSITGGFTGIGYCGSGASTVSKATVGGMWLAKLYGSYKVTPEYKVTLQGIYIGDTAKNGDTFGTSLNAVWRPEE